MSVKLVSLPNVTAFMPGSNLLSELCRLRKQWGMLISSASGTYDGIKGAAPYLTVNGIIRIMIDGHIYLFFESEAACHEAYNLTVGEDGPTSANSYDGPDRIYAITCDPTGSLRNENT